MNPQLPIVADRVQLSFGTVAPTDAFAAGMRLRADNLAVRAAALAGIAPSVNGGLTYTADGRLLCTETPGALPAGFSYSNGLPIHPFGHLCFTDAPAVTYSNGVPLAANGAVAAGVPMGPELISNGDFSNGSTDWVLGDGWAVTDGKLVATDAPANSFVTRTQDVVIAGRTYDVSITSDSLTTGGWKLLLEGGTNVVGDQTTAGTFRVAIVAPVTGNIYLWVNSILTASFTDISFREFL